MPSRRITIALISISILLTGVAFGADAEPTDEVGFVQAFQEGNYNLLLRYRLESVDQDGFDDDALASTLRTVLRMETKSWKHLRLFLEFENVTDIGTDGEYNNAGRDGYGNGVTDRPVIADPEGTEVNQAYIGIDLPWGSDLWLGRYEWALQDQRWVGPVGWRQNHQSFDGGVWKAKGSNAKWDVQAGYIDNVNRIFGDNKRMSSPLVDVGYKLSFGSVGVFGYLLDYDKEEDFGLSTRTLGARFAGKNAIGSGAITYHLQYAKQDDAGDNPNVVDAEFVRAELGGTISGFSGGLGYELLSGEPGKGKLSTPLATLHKFNGFADKFLTTPDTGLEDTYLHLGWAGNGFSAKAIYHQFDADTGGADYGSEIDFVVSYRTSWKQVFAIKGAFYSADDFATDTDKLWFWTQYTF